MRKCVHVCVYIVCVGGGRVGVCVREREMRGERERERKSEKYRVREGWERKCAGGRMWVCVCACCCACACKMPRQSGRRDRERETERDIHT